MLTCRDRKSTRLNSSHGSISYAVFCLKKKKNQPHLTPARAPRTSTTTALRPPARRSRAVVHVVVPVPSFPLYISRVFFFFFFNDPAPPEISPLSLPAALPISARRASRSSRSSRVWSPAAVAGGMLYQ